MATRSIDYSEYGDTLASPFPSESFLREAIQKNIGNMNNEGTAYYRPVGEDTLTIGDQDNWVELRKKISGVKFTFCYRKQLYDEIDAIIEQGIKILQSQELQEIQQFVGMTFSQVPEVLDVFFDEEVNQYQVVVLITSKKYNRELQDKLFDLEIDVLDRFPYANLSFRYYPDGLVGNILDFISRNAVHIYSRE